MAINLAALKTEATLPKYNGWGTQAIADNLNARTISASVDIDIKVAIRRLISTEVLGKIKARIDYHVSKLAAEPAINSSSELKLVKLYVFLAALEFLPDLEMSKPAVKTYFETLLTDLVNEGVMAPAQRTQFIALSDGFTSRSEQLFGELVGAGHVARALAS